MPALIRDIKLSNIKALEKKDAQRPKMPLLAFNYSTILHYSRKRNYYVEVVLFLSNRGNWKKNNIQKSFMAGQGHNL